MRTITPLYAKPNEAGQLPAAYKINLTGEIVPTWENAIAEARLWLLQGIEFKARELRTRASVGLDDLRGLAISLHVSVSLLDDLIIDIAAVQSPPGPHGEPLEGDGSGTALPEFEPAREATPAWAGKEAGEIAGAKLDDDDMPF